MTKRIDLSIGGTDWEGWYFGPWGRAKGWRLHDPLGTSYHACEIATVRQNERELGYLQVVSKQLRQEISEMERPLHQIEVEALQIVIALLVRVSGDTRKTAKIKRFAADHEQIWQQISGTLSSKYR